MKRNARPRPAARWMVLLASLPVLGACGTLHSLPSPPGSGPGAPAIPGPFENYDPARPPAFKKAPERSSKQPPAKDKEESKGDEDVPEFGGVLRPGLPGPPWGRGGRDQKDD